MVGIQKFEQIEAWKSARELTRLVYALTNESAFARDYGLKDQIQRACVSVMSNIAEGFESRTDNQFINYLGHAKGSVGEARAQLYVALDLGYISEAQFAEAQELGDKTARQVSRFIAYLEAHPHSVREEATEYETDV